MQSEGEREGGFNRGRNIEKDRSLGLHMIHGTETAHSPQPVHASIYSPLEPPPILPPLTLLTYLSGPFSLMCLSSLHLNAWLQFTSTTPCCSDYHILTKLWVKKFLQNFLPAFLLNILY